ncbi:MAG TPA: hypothetical protein VNU26_05745, partial [Mycobacteriales bacterium]|nr:hypothetical protein [Mycobacteriales bacterium]
MSQPPTTTTLACPSCAAALTGAPRCTSCGVTLVGPDAQRLWQVDQRLAALGREQAALAHERTALLTRLAAAPGAATEPEGARQIPAERRGLVPPAGAGETRPSGVQNTLLAMGGLLLALAATVFAAVTYSRTGVAGRALLLLVCTVAAVAVTVAARRRQMLASAEAAGFVAVALGVLDMWSAKHAGLVGQDISWGWWLAGGFGVLAASSLLLAWSVRVRVPLVAGVVFAHLPVPILLGELHVGVGTAAVCLALLVAADVVLLTVLAPMQHAFARSLRATTATVAVVPGAAAVLLALAAGVDPDEHLLGAAAFTVLAVPLLALA